MSLFQTDREESKNGGADVVGSQGGARGPMDVASILKSTSFERRAAMGMNSTTSLCDSDEESSWA